MKGQYYVFITGIIALFVSGCVTVEKVVRDRVDQDIKGNQGIIYGKEPASRTGEIKKREYVDVKVEVPTWQEVKKTMQKRSDAKPADDKQIRGNRGYITQGGRLDKELPAIDKPQRAEMPTTEPIVARPAEDTAMPPVSEEAQAMAIESAKKTEPPRSYVVKEGDSLSKISKELYGKASKWTLLYEANADKIKDPNRIKAGTVLVVPALEEEPSSTFVK